MSVAAFKRRERRARKLAQKLAEALAHGMRPSGRMLTAAFGPVILCPEADGQSVVVHNISAAREIEVVGGARSFSVPALGMAQFIYGGRQWREVTVP